MVVMFPYGWWNVVGSIKTKYHTCISVLDAILVCMVFFSLSGSAMQPRELGNISSYNGFGATAWWKEWSPIAMLVHDFRVLYHRRADTKGLGAWP